MENTDELNEIIEPEEQEEETIPVEEPETVDSESLEDYEEVILLLEQILETLENETLEIEAIEQDQEFQRLQLESMQAIVENTKPIEVEEVTVTDEMLERQALELYSDISIIVISFLLVIMMMYKLIQSVFNTLTRHII